MTKSNLDFYASYHGLTAKDVSRIGGEREMDVYARLQLLTLTLPSDTLKEVGRGMYRDLVHRPDGHPSNYDQFIAQRRAQMDRLGLLSSPPEQVALMPEHSFALQFTLTLRKPYLSKDDELLHVIDNPVAKDRVFRVPMVRSSSWKGTLRSAARLTLSLGDCDEQMVRLFGSEKGEREEKLEAGRLFFYTTFFDRVDLEIINPHDRERKVGVNPILIESVPVGARGMFSLLYAPFDLLTASKDRLVTEVRADLEAVTESLRALMLDLGFSAKRTSGYGVIHDRDLDGHLWFKRDGEVSDHSFNTFCELKNVCQQIIGGQAND